MENTSERERLEEWRETGRYEPAPNPARRKRECSVCGSRDHNRTAHGWSGRNMSNANARDLARARRS